MKQDILSKKIILQLYHEREMDLGFRTLSNYNKKNNCTKSYLFIHNKKDVERKQISEYKTVSQYNFEKKCNSLFLNDINKQEIIQWFNEYDITYEKDDDEIFNENELNIMEKNIFGYIIN